MNWKKPLYYTSISFILFTTLLSLTYAEWEIYDEWVIADEWVIRGLDNGNGNGNGDSENNGWSFGSIITNAYMGFTLLSVGFIIVIAFGLILMVQEQMTMTDFAILTIGLATAIIVIFLYLVVIGQFSTI